MKKGDVMKSEMVRFRLGGMVSDIFGLCFFWSEFGVWGVDVRWVWGRGNRRIGEMGLMKYMGSLKRFVERAVELRCTQCSLWFQRRVLVFFPLSDGLSFSWRSVVVIVIIPLARSQSHGLQNHALSSLYLVQCPYPLTTHSLPFWNQSIRLRYDMNQTSSF